MYTCIYAHANIYMYIYTQLYLCEGLLNPNLLEHDTTLQYRTGVCMNTYAILYRQVHCMDTHFCYAYVFICVYMCACKLLLLAPTLKIVDKSLYTAD